MTADHSPAAPQEGTTPTCPECSGTTFRHLHAPAYADLPQTHMAGSERFECVACGRSVFAADRQPGFTFTMDTP